MSATRPSLKGVKDGTRLEWKVHPENKDEVEILFAGQRSISGRYEEKWRNINLEIIIARHGSACIEVVVFDADFGEENTRIFLSIDALLQAFHTELELRLAEQKELCLRKKKEFEVQTVTDIIVDQLIIEYCFTKLRATGEVPMEAEEGNSESSQKSAHPNDFAVAIPGCNCDPPEGLHKLVVSYRKSAELNEIIHVKKKFQLEKQSFGELKRTTNLLTAAAGGFASAATTGAKHQLLLHHRRHSTITGLVGEAVGAGVGTGCGRGTISMNDDPSLPIRVPPTPRSVIALSRWVHAVQQVIALNGLIKAKNRLLQSSWRDWLFGTLSPVQQREVRAFGRFLDLYEKMWPNMKGRRNHYNGHVYHPQHRSIDSFGSTNTSSGIHSRSSSYDVVLSNESAGDAGGMVPHSCNSPMLLTVSTSTSTASASPISTAQSNSQFFPDTLGLLPPPGFTSAAGFPPATSIGASTRSSGSVKDRIMHTRRPSSKQQQHHHHHHHHHSEATATGAAAGAPQHISERMFCRLDCIPDIHGAPSSLSSSCSLSHSGSGDTAHDPLQHGIYVGNWGSSDGIATTTISTTTAPTGTAVDNDVDDNGVTATISSKSDTTHDHHATPLLALEASSTKTSSSTAAGTGTVSNREDRWKRLSERTKRRARRSLDSAEFHRISLLPPLQKPQQIGQPHQQQQQQKVGEMVHHSSKVGHSGYEDTGRKIGHKDPSDSQVQLRTKHEQMQHRRNLSHSHGHDLINNHKKDYTSPLYDSLSSDSEGEDGKGSDAVLPIYVKHSEYQKMMARRKIPHHSKHTPSTQAAADV